MLERDDIRDAVLRAFDTVCESLVDQSDIQSDEATVLLGEGATLDSMGFVNLVVAVEEEMSRIVDRPFHLTQALTAPDLEIESFSTVGQFVDFLQHLVNI